MVVQVQEGSSHIAAIINRRHGSYSRLFPFAFYFSLLLSHDLLRLTLPRLCGLLLGYCHHRRILISGNTSSIATWPVPTVSPRRYYLYLTSCEWASIAVLSSLNRVSTLRSSNSVSRCHRFRRWCSVKIQPLVRERPRP